MSAHLCHAPGCTRTIPPRLFACPAHWRLVPRWLQAWLLKEYRSGQERDKKPSARYCAVQTRCRLDLARLERSWDRSLLFGIEQELSRWIGHAELTEAESVRLREGL